MALLNFLKKKKEPKKPSKKGPLLKPVEKKEVKPTETIKPQRKTIGKSYRILQYPHVTEKATRLVDKNQYIFKVWPDVNKNQVKQAVESTYGVEVVGVRVINIHRKKRRMGRHTGWKKGYKKAIVEIKKGQKIEILPR